MRHTGTRLAIIAVAGLLWSPAATAHLSADHGTVPLHAKYKGLTSGEWLAVWWQEIFATSIEAGSHPLIDGGAFGGRNRTVFLGGPVLPAGSPKVTIPVTVPARTHLVVPIITVECSVEEEPPFHGGNEAELRACANGLFDLVSEPYAEIDGQPVKNPGAYRVETPLFRYGPLTAKNALGLRPGTQSDAVGAGYVLLLPPLSAGVHRIRVRANVDAVGLSTDTEFIILVERPRGR